MLNKSPWNVFLSLSFSLSVLYYFLHLRKYSLVIITHKISKRMFLKLIKKIYWCMCMCVCTCVCVCVCTCVHVCASLYLQRMLQKNCLLDRASFQQEKHDFSPFSLLQSLSGLYKYSASIHRISVGIIFFLHGRIL